MTRCAPAGRQLVVDVASQGGLVLANAGPIEDLQASRLPPKVPGDNHAAPSSHTTPQDVTS